MIFRRISYRIALQFTMFVFLLLLMNGAIFLVVDFTNARRQSHDRLVRTSSLFLNRGWADVDGLVKSLPPPIRARVRIADPDGHVLYSGAVFDDVPLTLQKGFTEMEIQHEDYTILTMNVMRGENPVGSLQVADVERSPLRDIPLRALLYLLLSASISALTFIVGLFFARRSLRPAEQMVERLEQFTQDASHELRTPLAALSSSLDLALKNKKYQEGIVSAKQDLKEVSTLVERLLELARLDKFVIESAPVDFSQLTEETVAKYRPLASEKNVALMTHIASNIRVKGDESLLRQIIGNLLSNAIRFSKHEGGTVTVRLTKHTLTVEDTGIGIAKKSLPHIFNRFYQAESSRAKDGYGLGLALVKRIVDLHGWTIGAESEEGKGATFRVHLKTI